jgi:hypothetical protein
MHFRQLIFLYALVGWIVFVAVRIEVLNAAAGNLLPGFNEALTRNKADGGSGKWRARWMTEAKWRRENIRDAEGEPDARALTPEEQSRMRVEVERANAYARLHDFISYFGWMLQYVLVFVACVVGAGWTIEHRRRPGLAALYVVATLVAVAAGALAVYRGYFSSMATGI